MQTLRLRICLKSNPLAFYADLVCARSVMSLHSNALRDHDSCGKTAGSSCLRRRICLKSNRQQALRVPSHNQALRDCLSCCSGCLAGVKLRVLFLEGAGAVMNSAATEAANKAKRGHACGSCCANPQLAVPECFIAKNWNNGWVSKVMFEAWADFGIEIVALTPANYSAETLAPSKGSLFERCIWEVRSGTVVNHSVDLTSFREKHYAFWHI